MEVLLAGLIILWLVFALVVAPVVALVRNARNAESIRDLRRSVRDLRQDLDLMTRADASPVPEPVAAAPAVAQAPPPPIDPPIPPTAAEPAAPLRRPEPSTARAINWEIFTGTRLFAWIGGLALFLGVAFLLKHSIDQGWISPAVRVAAGFLLGAGSVVGGLRLHRSYAVTGQTLCAAGPAILYATTFAAHSWYGFIGQATAFTAMTVWTAGAFLLAVRLDARYVALLGLASGFLTPMLLTTSDPLALFAYIALLDVGLVAVALDRRWTFLVGLGALGTAFTQLAWTGDSFHVDGAVQAAAIDVLFPILFIGAALFAARRGRLDRWFTHSAGALTVLSMLLAGWLAQQGDLASRPGLVLGLPLALGLLITAAAVLRDELRGWQRAAGAIAFALLAHWTAVHLDASTLAWALAFNLAFAVLHVAVPLVVARLRPGVRSGGLTDLYPLLGLLIALIPIARGLSPSMMTWPTIAAIAAVAVLAALATGITWALVAALVLTLASAGLWTLQFPDSGLLSGQLVVIGFFAVAFFALGGLLARRRGTGTAETAARSAMWLRLQVLSAALPFALLCMAVLTVEVSDPSAVFALAALLVVLLLGLARRVGAAALPLVALAAVTTLELTWHVRHFDASEPWRALTWYGLFWIAFLVYPFVTGGLREHARLPWIAAAASGPLHFLPVHDAVTRALGDANIGLLAALFAAVHLVALLVVARRPLADRESRLSRLAWLGGATLLFVTLVVPLQLDREWVTIGWAGLGLALVWLRRRLPHPGLEIWAGGLLTLAFVRLAANPAVLSYHPRTELPLWNWYLYAFGGVAVIQLLAARLWRGQLRLGGLRVASALRAFGGVLLFVLVNIEIADYFSTGSALTFRIGAGLAQDMTYSLAWALFGLILLVIALATGQRGPRVASVGLLGLTTIKLFLHDIWQLGGLYRVGAFVGLAGILILVSFLYQRYLDGARSTPSTETEVNHV